MASQATGMAATPLWALKATNLLSAAAFACVLRFITVFYADIGLNRVSIGVLQFAGTLSTFVGSLAFSWLIDRTGDYKWTLVTTNIAGSAFLLCNMLPMAQSDFTLMLLVALLWNFFLSTSGPIIDAMCVQVIEEQGAAESYGDQRLWTAVGWGGMSLIAGKLIDRFGMPSMFYGFILVQAANLVICVVWFPSSSRRDRKQAVEESVDSSSASFHELCTCEIARFFLNLLQYGVCFALVETFILVFLVEDFENTPKLLLGASIAVMCAFEVPVFMYVGRLWERDQVIVAGASLQACDGKYYAVDERSNELRFRHSNGSGALIYFDCAQSRWRLSSSGQNTDFDYVQVESVEAISNGVWTSKDGANECKVTKQAGCNLSLDTVLVLCQLLLALRCVLYTLLPKTCPWFVLFVEPLHGVTFAAMWAATVEYGKRIAPPGALVRMMALINGIFYNVAMGLGALFWGALVALPPNGLGFKPCFVLDATFIVAWCVIWACAMRLRRSRHELAGDAAKLVEY